MTSSPNYAQSNGLAERAVQICKNILKKSENEEQILISLMAYRATPTKHMNYTPSQLVQNRIIRTDIPMHTNKSKPKLCNDAENQLQKKQQKSKEYYDKSVKLRVGLKVNEKVLFKNNDKWIIGHIIALHESPRSYIIQSNDGRVYRRNSIHIKKYYENQNENNSNENAQKNGESESWKLTRSGKRY